MVIFCYIIPQMNGTFNIDIHNLNLPLEYHKVYKKEYLMSYMTH